MPFDLQSNIPDRALPHALQTYLAQQVNALEALICDAQAQSDVIRANEHLTDHDKVERLATLTTETNQQLTELEHKNIEIERQIGEFQDLVRQQGNPILGYTLERVREVMEGNFVMAREWIDWM